MRYPLLVIEYNMHEHIIYLCINTTFSSFILRNVCFSPLPISQLNHDNDDGGGGGMVMISY